LIGVCAEAAVAASADAAARAAIRQNRSRSTVISFSLCLRAGRPPRIAGRHSVALSLHPFGDVVAVMSCFRLAKGFARQRVALCFSF
jgi:hypothetical protein